MADIASWTSTYNTAGERRYSLSARWFHWLTTLLVLAIVPLGWIFAEFKTKAGGVFEAPLPGTAGDYASAHKTLGLVVLALVAVRLAYRVVHRPPALPGSVPSLQRGLAHATHWLLYLVLLVMPVSGYIMSSGSNRPISIFGLFDFPKLPVTAAVAKNAQNIHLFAQYAVYALVIFHVAGVCWHLFVRRDDLIARMLPRQANVE